MEQNFNQANLANVEFFFRSPKFRFLVQRSQGFQGLLMGFLVIPPILFLNLTLVNNILKMIYVIRSVPITLSHIKIQGVSSTFLYCSKCWALLALQQGRLNSFQTRLAPIFAYILVCAKKTPHMYEKIKQFLDQTGPLSIYFF